MKQAWQNTVTDDEPTVKRHIDGTWASRITDLPSEFFLDIAVSATESSLWLAFNCL